VTKVIFDVDEVLSKWFEQQRGDTVPVSSLLMITLFFTDFNFKLMYFLW